jgi:hypothetical protein
MRCQQSTSARDERIRIPDRTSFPFFMGDGTGTGLFRTRETAILKTKKPFRKDETQGAHSTRFFILIDELGEKVKRSSSELRLEMEADCAN